MRAAAARLGPLLEALPGLSLVALHGEVDDLVRDTARAIVRAEIGEGGDSLRVATLHTGEARIVEAALRAGVLGGGRPVVWVAEASEKWVELADDVLRGGPSALLVAGFGARFAKSALAARVGESAHGVVVECALDAAATGQRLRAALAACGVTVEPAALRALAAWADGSGQSVAIAGTLAGLLAGAGGRVDAELVAQLGGEPDGGSDGGSVGAAVRAGLGGDIEALDRAVARSRQEGQSGVGLLRQTLGQVQFARTMGLRRRGDDTGALALDATTSRLWAAERGAKRTGAPQDLIAAHAVRALARRGG